MQLHFVLIVILNSIIEVLLILTRHIIMIYGHTNVSYVISPVETKAAIKYT